MNDDEDMPLGMEVNECGFHVSRIIACLNHSHDSRSEKAAADVVALAKEHVELKRANENIKAISQQMAQASLAMSERDKLRKELDNELCVNKNLIDELAKTKQELKRYSRIIDVKEEWALDLERRMNAAQKSNGPATANPAIPTVDHPDMAARAGPARGGKETQPWQECTKLPLTVEFREAVPGETITTIDGTGITMTADHLVMRGSHGELYPITKAIFHDTYIKGKKSFTQGIATPDGCCFFHVNPRMDEDPCLLGITRSCKRCSRYVIASCARASSCPLRPGSKCKGVACKTYKGRNDLG